MKKTCKFLALLTSVLMLTSFLSAFSFAQTENPLLTIACISDLHNQEILLTNGSIRGSITETCNALAATEDVDVLLLGGDVSSDTQVSQDKLYSVLDNVVNATTKVTDNVFWVTGNHDYSCGEKDGYNSAPYYDYYMKDNVGELSDSDSYYETYQDEVNLLAYHYVVNGFDFICINTAHETLYGNLQNSNYAYTNGAMNWVENKLDEIGKEKTVFVMGHLPFNDSNSLSSSSKGMVEPCNTTFKNILSKYPNVLYIYGHDHGTDSAYIRTDTAQRVTQYKSDGTKDLSSAAVVNITQSSLWSFESTSGGYYIESVETGKYLGIDGNLNTVTTPVVWSASFNSGNYTFGYNGQYIHCGTGNKFSYGSASNIVLYKKEGDTYKKSTTIEAGEQYLLVAGGGYAMTNVTNGSNGNALRLEPLSVNVSGDYVGNAPESPATPSFISAFMGSMRYYNNSIDAWVGPSNSKVVQSLLIYVYSDRIELQMKNYGISDGGSYELKPYVISRTIVDTSTLNFSELKSAKAAADAILNLSTYQDYTLQSRNDLEAAIAATDVKFVYQQDIDNAVQVLNDAVSQMELQPTVIDRTALSCAIATARLIMSDPDYSTKYPQDKRIALELALDDAEAALSSDDSAQVFSAARTLLGLSHDMSGHSFTVYLPDNNATCTQNGTETAVCDIEGCTQTDTREVPDSALGHKWGEYEYNNDATLEADGTKTRTCSVCEKTETVTAEGTKIVLVDSSKIFSDVVEGKWYKKYVDYVATMQLMIGTSETEFEPDTNLTRAMFVQILANISGVDTSDRNVTTKFIDVPANKWYTPAVKWASENGIVNGLDENNFGPSENIQRQQMCVMLVRYANAREITLKETVAQTVFADDSQISNYAREAVYACQKAEIVNGVDAAGNFEPRGNATRSQISKIIAVFHQDYMLGK